MASPAISAHSGSRDRPRQHAAPGQAPRDTSLSRRPFFSGDTTQWLALQPVEQAAVLLAAYQERVLPELARIERLLTHLAVEYGLEYCRVEQLAVSFLEVAGEVHDHLRALEGAAAAPVGDTSRFELAVGHPDMAGLIPRLSSLANSCLTDKHSSPCYTRLADGLRNCQCELAELMALECELAD